MTTFIEPAASKTDWETPKWLFEALDSEFRFTLDVCANPGNAKCLDFYSPEQDALVQPWSGVCWMNPPYGKEIGGWIKKAFDTAASGEATVVCLLPARSNNEWWKYVIHAEVRFIRKKLQFVGADSVSMFPNVIAVFRPYLERSGTMKIWRRSVFSAGEKL